MAKKNLLKRLAMVTVPVIGLTLAGQAYALTGNGKSEPVRFGFQQPIMVAAATTPTAATTPAATTTPAAATSKVKVKYPTNLEGDMMHMFNLGKARDGQDATSFYNQEPVFSNAIDAKYGNKDRKLTAIEAKKFADERNRFNPAVNNYPQKCGDNYGIVYQDGSVAIIPGTALGGPNPDCNGKECIQVETIAPTVPVTEKVVEQVTVPHNYANLKGIEYAVVLPKVAGAYWPTVVKGGNMTTDILGYDEDGSMRISKYDYPLSEKALVSGILYEALAGNIETRRFSNGVLTNAIARKTGTGVGSDYVRENGLEGIISQDSCYGNKSCATFTPEELVTAAANLAVYDASARIVIAKIEQDTGVKLENMEDLKMFANETWLEDYSKTLFGFLTPTNVITGLSTGWTGRFANGNFKKGYKNLQKTLVSCYDGNPDKLFADAYDKTSELFISHYNGGVQE